MSRPTKLRIINNMPQSEGFIPLGYHQGVPCDTVIMSVDEYETIRLIDLTGFTQEECSKNMNISRSTVTNIYNSARLKLADSLVHEKILLIEGGDFKVSYENKKIGKLEKEKNNMKIAVTYDNGEIYQHFGHCENFKIYSVENEKVTSSSIVNASGSGHGALAGFLKNLNVDILICGGIGGGAQDALAQENIKLFGGVSGNADNAVNALLAGSLEYDANVHCNHHGHGEGHSCGSHGHDEGHSCGGHGHGEGHSCGGHGHGEGHSCGK